MVDDSYSQLLVVEYPEFARELWKELLLFATTYLCESILCNQNKIKKQGYWQLTDERSLFQETVQVNLAAQVNTLISKVLKFST